MSLDFARIKEIKLVDIMGRYGITLRFKGEYAAAICPLSTHKEGDTSKSFSINLVGNYWRCFSESCNANNGGKKGGDVINFVALKEGISQLEAAKKLAAWYGIADAKTTRPRTWRSRQLKPTCKGLLQRIALRW
jgi:DNA primase